MDVGLYGNGFVRDWMLVKMALEGKNYQAARLEAKAMEESPQQQLSPSVAPSSPTTQVASSGVQVEIAALDVRYAEARIDTPKGTVVIEAAQVQATRMTITSGSTAAARKKDPLVVDLSGAGPTTTGADGARVFDLEGKGSVGLTSFATGDTAFLALDRNGNGVIDSGRELFGDQHGAAHGYEELARFDADAHGQIDDKDPVFNQLRLLHENGRLSTLAEHGITSLNLNAQSLPGLTNGGDDITHRATAQRNDGRTYATYALQLQQWDQLV